jgi:hypothetical protein
MSQLFCPSPSQPNATYRPSGENVAPYSDPLIVVSGAMCIAGLGLDRGGRSSHAPVSAKTMMPAPTPTARPSHDAVLRVWPLVATDWLSVALASGAVWDSWIAGDVRSRGPGTTSTGAMKR